MLRSFADRHGRINGKYAGKKEHEAVRVARLGQGRFYAGVKIVDKLADVLKVQFRGQYTELPKD